MTLKKYNPFGEFRIHQEEAIKEILEYKQNGVQNIILKAPVASGKSLIAYVAAKYLEAQNENSYMITSTKFLQNQYLRDFKDLRTVMGRNNFDCCHNGRTCDRGSCKEMCRFQCPNSIDEDMCLKLSREESCPYWVQKVDAINAPISIFNYKYALIDHNYVHHFPVRDFIVFDEAHNVEKEILDFLEVEILPKQIFNDISYNIDPNLRDMNEWADVFYDISVKYKNAADNAYQTGDKKKFDTFISKAESYRFTHVYLKNNPENWVIDIDQGNLHFKPIMINEYAHKSLFSIADTRLFMSGSIVKNNSFCEALGIDDYEIIEIPSIIDPSRRPIYKEYAGSMSMRNRDANIDNICAKIMEIVNRYPDEKGVIHTYTYTISNMLAQRLNSDRFVFHNSKNRQSQTEKFIRSNRPLVFVSPYSFEGVDFKDDKARFQIMVKNPFPNLFNNNQYQERDRMSDFHWIFEERSKILSQAYGRVVRDPDDYADTYLIDSDIQSLLGPSSLITGYMLEGFVDSWINKEIIILDETRLSPDKRKSYARERQNEQVILSEIKRMKKPTVTKLIELFKNLPNDAYKEVQPTCERLVNNKAIELREG